MSLDTGLTDVASVIGTRVKTLFANDGNLLSLVTTDKTSLVHAVNEVNTASKAYSLDVTGDIAAMKSEILGGADGAHDSLNELNNIRLAQLGAATVADHRVRWDISQGLTGTQQAQSCTNIGLGDATTDLATMFDNAVNYISARYWRIKSTNISSSYYPGSGLYNYDLVLRAFEAFESINHSGPNVATPSTIVAVSGGNIYGPLSYVVDGNDSTWAGTYATGSVPGTSMSFEFPSIVAIRSIRVHPMLWPTSYDSFPIGFDIQNSNDGVTWHTVASRSVPSHPSTAGAWLTFDNLQ